MQVVAYAFVRIVATLLVFSFILSLNAGCATTAPTESKAGEPAAKLEGGSSTNKQQLGLSPLDPWEPFNRSIYGFNDWVDRNFFAPVAKAYVAVTPTFVRNGVGSFFSNLREPINVVNNILQGDGQGAGTSLMRFVTNSVFGFFGLLDVATAVGMRENQEDFGQTLASWGVAQGNYLVLPFLGPTTTRDVFSNVDSLYYDQYWPAESSGQRFGAFLLHVTNIRAGLLEVEKQIIGDRYTFIRDAYLQRREFKVNDGAVVGDSFTLEAEDEGFSDLDDAF